MRDTSVAIVGAGPYGLSLAAYLRDLGVEHTIFGSPMSFWLDSVPPGMELKSEGASSDLFDPRREYPIKSYYEETSRSFAGRVIVPAEAFVEYGRKFQQKFAPEVDARKVTNIARAADKYILGLQDGSQVRAARVVIATGIRDFAQVPGPLTAMPKEFVTHSAMYGAVDQLRGQKVIVIGGGASAVDLAWSLHERGSDVSIVCRRASIKFHDEPSPRTWSSAIRSPDSPIGGGWKLWFYAKAPKLFRFLPTAMRLRIVATTLGPAPGWFMTPRVRPRIPIFSGQEVTGCKAVEGTIHLETKSADGKISRFTADHIVAATGYSVDVNKIPYLDDRLKAKIRLNDGFPVLSGNFESSEPGLYFVGVTSAGAFGPVMRFVAGAGFTVRRLSAHLGRSRNSRVGRSETVSVRQMTPTKISP